MIVYHYKLVLFSMNVYLLKSLHLCPCLLFIALNLKILPHIVKLRYLEMRPHPNPRPHPNHTCQKIKLLWYFHDHLPSLAFN